jgi:hypothetical protein
MRRALIAPKADAVDGAILMARKAQGLDSWISA